jgi:hypothetical protein
MYLQMELTRSNESNQHLIFLLVLILYLITEFSKCITKEFLKRFTPKKNKEKATVLFLSVPHPFDDLGKARAFAIHQDPYPVDFC